MKSNVRRYRTQVTRRSLRSARTPARYRVSTPGLELQALDREIWPAATPSRRSSSLEGLAPRQALGCETWSWGQGGVKRSEYGCANRPLHPPRSVCSSRRCCCSWQTALVSLGARNAWPPSSFRGKHLAHNSLLTTATSIAPPFTDCLCSFLGAFLTPPRRQQRPMQSAGL